MNSDPTDAPAPRPSRAPRPAPGPTPAHDRPWISRAWYRLNQLVLGGLLSVFYSLRVTGRENLPSSGAALLVSNHLSHLDVIALGVLLPRPLNYVARSTLFFPPLGWMIRSLGAFPIQREGMGASGMKETLRRLKQGGIVTLFPEGTRTLDGELGELKQGVAALASRARVPILPVALAGTFEAWPRGKWLPHPHPLRIHYGRPIAADEAAAMGASELTDLIRERLLEVQRQAREGLAGDLGFPSDPT